MTQKGDKVKIGYDENGSGVIDISMFDNLAIKVTKTEEQIKSDTYFKNVNDSAKNEIKMHDAKIDLDKMSSEDKKKMLEYMNAHKKK